MASQSLQILQWPVSKDVTLCFNDREYASHDSNGAINKTYLVQNGSFAIQMESLISHLSTFENLITVQGMAQSKRVIPFTCLTFILIRALDFGIILGLFRAFRFPRAQFLFN